MSIRGEKRMARKLRRNAREYSNNAQWTRGGRIRNREGVVAW